MDLEDLIILGVVGIGGYYAYTYFIGQPSTTGTTTSSPVGIPPVQAIAYVNTLYQTILGRSPDPGGAASWVGQLVSGSLTEAQVYQAFLNSTEFQTDVANEQKGLPG